MKAKINMHNTIEKAQRGKIAGYGVPVFKEIMLPDFRVKILKKEKGLRMPKTIEKGLKRRNIKVVARKRGTKKSDMA